MLHNIFNYQRSNTAIPSGYSSEITATAPPKTAKNGGGERDRTDDLLRARQALSQLSYTPNPIMVGLTGLEPVTSRLSGVRSNQN